MITTKLAGLCRACIFVQYMPVSCLARIRTLEALLKPWTIQQLVAPLCCPAGLPQEPA